MSPLLVKPQLVDLYCFTGQPDRALELMAMGAIEDPNLGTEPGSSFMRQGQVYFLLGNYLTADHLWRMRAIPRLRSDRTVRALTMGQTLTRGELTPATNSSLVLPSLVARQAYWEFDLALCLLESGSPDRAAESFAQVLKLAPDLPVRPIVAYYLQKLGKPVPELPSKDDVSLPRSTTTAPAEPAKTTVPKEAPKPAPGTGETKKK